MRRAISSRDGAGPGAGYEWPESEHGISFDQKGNVWLAGSDEKDGQLLKFTKDGKFVMQVGHKGQSKGNADTQNMHGAADVFVPTAKPMKSSSPTATSTIASSCSMQTPVGSSGCGALRQRAHGPTRRQEARAGLPGTAPSRPVQQRALVRISNDGLV